VPVLVGVRRAALVALAALLPHEMPIPDLHRPAARMSGTTMIVHPAAMHSPLLCFICQG
jgi:hypothetical protein